MKKKVLSLMLATAMIASMTAGCGGNNGGTTDAGNSGTTDAGTTNAGTDTGSDAGESAGGANKLTVYAWDANFNIPALQPKSRIISTQNVRALEPPVCQEIIDPAQ